MAGRNSAPQGSSPGQARVEEVRAALSGAGLGGLSYGQLAVALSASDMPTSRQGEVPAEWVVKWARQGVDRLGERGVRELNERSSRINLALVNGEISRAEHAALVRQIWGSSQRATRSHDRALAAIRLVDAGRSQ